MRFIRLAPLLLLIGFPVAAAETAWQEVVPGVKLRLIADARRAADGTTLAALEVDMPDAMKTYWRVPGESGIPTEVDFAGSTAGSGAAQLWPYPVIDQRDGLVDFVYYGPVVLPVVLQAAGASGELRARVQMGICSDICMPVSVSFVLPVDFDTPDAAQSLRIAEAVARSPLEWSDTAAAVAGIHYDKEADALAITGLDPRIDPSSLIADFGPAGQLFGAPQKSRDGQAILLPLLGGSGEDIGGRDITLTFMTAAGPYWISGRVEADGSTTEAR